MADNNKRFQELYKAEVKMYPQESLATVQKKSGALWTEVKLKEREDKSSTI